MNREILFRGKRIDNGEWVEGYYVLDPKGNSRIYWKPFGEATSNTYHFVDPESVGQFIGLFDKNIIKIYEGDIVSKTEPDYDNIGEDPDYDNLPQKETRDVVDISRHCFWLKNESFGYEGEDLQDADHYEVIGNITDNPELLK